MTKKNNQPVPLQVKKDEGKFSDENTDLKIHQHLSDKNDQITEQDIENVKTDFEESPGENLSQTTPAAITGNDKDEKGADSDVEEEREAENDAHPIVTPWNILGS